MRAILRSLLTIPSALQRVEATSKLVLQKVNQMSEQLKVIADALGNIETDLDAVATDHGTLVGQIADLQAKVNASQPVDPTEVQALADRANAIDSKLKGLVSTASSTAAQAAAPQA